jgi:hypothetical protein
MADVVLALTLVGPRVPIQAAEWFAFDDPDLEEANLLGSRSQSSIEILPSTPGAYPTLDAEEAPPIVQAYLSLTGTVKDRVRVALQRLNQAQRRRNLGDRAVELSTALETLMGDNATTEMTHKIRTRAVRLIGGLEAKRKSNAAILNKAYNIRSSLVHTGKVDTGKVENVCEQKMSVADIIKHTTCMCADSHKDRYPSRFHPRMVGLRYHRAPRLKAQSSSLPSTIEVGENVERSTTWTSSRRPGELTLCRFLTRGAGKLVAGHVLAARAFNDCGFPQLGKLAPRNGGPSAGGVEL